MPPLDNRGKDKDSFQKGKWLTDAKTWPSAKRKVRQFGSCLPCLFIKAFRIKLFRSGAIARISIPDILIERDFCPSRNQSATGQDSAWVACCSALTRCTGAVDKRGEKQPLVMEGPGATPPNGMTDLSPLRQHSSETLLLQCPSRSALREVWLLPSRGCGTLPSSRRETRWCPRAQG